MWWQISAVLPAGTAFHDQVSVLGDAHCVSSSGAMLEQRHRPGEKLPQQSCDGSRP